MPDHLHLLILSWTPSADQLDLIHYLRRHLNRILAPDFVLQRQAYDHVLRDEEEKSAGAVATLAWYIAGNPVRAGLVANPPEYPFTGSLSPGYSELDMWQDNFWDRFWRIDASKR